MRFIQSITMRWCASVVSIVTLVAACTGCFESSAVPEPPKSDKVIALFEMCSANAEPARTLPSVHFWFDDSVSMQGYVSLQSAYKTIVRDMVQSAIQSGYESSIRGFSDPDSKPLRELTPVLNPGFYRIPGTPLAATIETIAAPPAESDDRRIVVMVSDLIQAEGTRDALSVSLALRRAAARYPFVAFYGFRSAFSGTYYVETPPRRRVQLSALDGTGRPFYLLILAESLDDLRQFQTLSHLNQIATNSRFDPHLFEPSAPPIVVKSAEIRVDPQHAAWSRFRDPAEWKCAERFSQIRAHRWLRGAQGIRPVMEIDLVANEHLPVITPGRYKVEIRKLDATHTKVIPAADFMVTSSGTAARASVRLKYELPPLPVKQWEVYSIRLRAGDANLSPPDWLARWSTEDDSVDIDTDSRDRTLNLMTFGDALTRALAEQVVFFDQVLELYRGD